MKQKKLRKLGAKVLAGKITIDEARAAIGRKAAQKNAVQKTAFPPYLTKAYKAPRGREITDRDLYKAVQRKLPVRAPQPPQDETQGDNPAAPHFSLYKYRQSFRDTPVIIKAAPQRTPVEERILAQMIRQRDQVAYDPVLREEYNEYIRNYAGGVC